jgi:photosystem II stability/assembly factor-like uncharacterized protein
MGWIEQQSAGIRNWNSIASSSDGIKLIASTNSEYLYTSTDSGVTWIQRASSRSWKSVTSSSDGNKLAAIAYNGSIWTSSDSGISWIEQTAAGTRTWNSIASNSDGTKLAAVGDSNLYISEDSGITWSEKAPLVTSQWRHITMTSDGSKLFLSRPAAFPWFSGDGGLTWTERTGAPSNLSKPVYSSNGARLVAAFDASGYTSTNNGISWTLLSGVSLVHANMNVDGSQLVLAGTGVIFRSIDSGMSWIEDHPFVQAAGGVTPISSDGKIVAVASGGYIYTYSPFTITIDETNNIVTTDTTWGDGNTLDITVPATVESGATLTLNVPSIAALTGAGSITVNPGASVSITGPTGTRTVTVQEGTQLIISPEGT